MTSYNRPRCIMTNEDLSIWSSIHRGQGRFWAQLLNHSLRQDKLDGRIMSLLTTHGTSWRSVRFLFDLHPTTPQGGSQS